MKNLIKKLLDENLSLIEKLRDQAVIIERIAKEIVEIVKNGGKIVLFGNGGSAADAQHLVCELVGGFKLKGQALPAMALTTNTSIITAVSNDMSFEEVFSRQVEALVTSKDLVIGISTSGESLNVVNGVIAAKRKGAKTIALTGGDGGKLAKISDISLVVPSKNTPRIQEAHIIVGHIICQIVEEKIIGCNSSLS
jgi:D-sedoheptulose 7-phosphate isomerase